MNKILLSLGGGLIACVLLFGAMLGFGYLGFTNDANRFENGLKAKLENNKNIYDNGWKEIKEMAQVPQLQEAALEKLYKAALQERRYGGEMVKFIQEQNPNLDQSTFIRIQQSIEKFRLGFTQAQTELVSQKQAYENYLTANTSGRFYNMLGGYPRIDMAQFTIVTSEETDADFKSHKSRPVNLLN